MKKRSLFAAVSAAVILVVLMTAAAEISFAEDSGISMVYQTDSEISPVALSMIQPDEEYGWFWKPDISQGDVLIITEDGNETRYVYDRAEYEGNDDIIGFYDDDGNPLTDRFRCNVSTSYDYETDEQKVSMFYPDFEWIGGMPTVSGQTAAYRFLLYEKDAPEGAEPVAATEPIDIYITPIATIDGIRYKAASDGTAIVDSYEDYEYEGTDYVIKESVTLDDGKTYKVAHIGNIDPGSSWFGISGSFMEFEELTSITIPDTITTIGSYSFFGNPNMKEVTIPPSVVKIDKFAFGYDGKYNLFDGGFKDVKLIEDFVIYAEAGSEGARYAKDNGIKCIDLKAQAKDAADDQAYEEAKAAAEAIAKNTPAKVKVTKVKAGKKRITIKWKKLSNAAAYEVRYSKDKSFKKGVKTLTGVTYKKKGLTIKKLRKKTKWYVQIRAYDTVDGETYYGPWSAKKSVKVK